MSKQHATGYYEYAISGSVIECCWSQGMSKRIRRLQWGRNSARGGLSDCGRVEPPASRGRRQCEEVPIDSESCGW